MTTLLKWILSVLSISVLTVTTSLFELYNTVQGTPPLPLKSHFIFVPKMAE
jgi:hypothetical protein